mmetsp:Transcript_4760/g.12680  ORF Transcript_4760/g.12680 Transcript_4760/m.12680 type:complete len:147 (-) Transcript_4760:226-666(-)
MLSDEDIAMFILTHQREILVGGVLVLIGLIYLNVRLWRRRRSSEAENEIVIDWSQNLDELEVDFPIPAGATSKDVECRITSTSIRFAFKGQSRTELEGTLYRPVVPDDCNWQLWPIGSPTHVKLSLIKAKTGHWKDVLAADDKKSS